MQIYELIPKPCKKKRHKLTIKTFPIAFFRQGKDYTTLPTYSSILPLTPVYKTNYLSRYTAFIFFLLYSNTCTCKINYKK